MTDDLHELDALSVSTIAIMAAILKKTTASRDDDGNAARDAAVLYRMTEEHVRGAKAFRGDLP